MVDVKVDDLLARIDREQQRAKVRTLVWVIIGLASVAVFFGPYFFKIGTSVFSGQSVTSAAYVQEQMTAWNRNPACGSTDVRWLGPSHGSQIATVVCPGTLDVLIIKRDPDGRMSQRFVRFDSLP